MPRISENDIEGWAERYSRHAHLGGLIGQAKSDRNIILLARGDSRPDVLRRLLPKECFDPREPDPTSEEAERFPPFVLGEKSTVSFSTGETLVRMPSAQLARVLPEVRQDRGFLSDLIEAAVEEQLTELARRDQDDLLPSLSLDDMLTWPQPIQELFIERLLMIMHFDQTRSCRTDTDYRRFSCAVSLAMDPRRYRRAVRFATSQRRFRQAIVIDSFVRGSEPETFVEGSQLAELSCEVDGVRWSFRFNPGGHPKNEVLVRRAIFPHRMLGIAALLRENDHWRCLRYIANPYFANVQTLSEDVDIPQHQRIPEMLANHDEYCRQLRLIYTHVGGSPDPPAYDPRWTREYLEDQDQ